MQTFQNFAKITAKASSYKHLILINTSSLSTLQLDFSILLHDYYHSMKHTKNVFNLVQTLSPKHMLLLRTRQNITFSSKYSQNTVGLKIPQSRQKLNAQTQQILTFNNLSEIKKNKTILLNVR